MLQVVLEGLEPGVQAAVDRHNREALALFVDYVRCYVEGLEGSGTGTGPAQEALPLSGVRLPAGPQAAAGGAGCSGTV